jgi:hypothetical protein
MDQHKELIRLRMEMYRQQVLYNAQPLRHPFEHLRQLMGGGPGRYQDARKAPWVLAATAFLALFGKRLGRVGTLARVGLLIYPMIKAGQVVKEVKDEYDQQTGWAEAPVYGPEAVSPPVTARAPDMPG